MMADHAKSMNLSETITALFDLQVVEVKILPPGRNNPLCVQANQLVITGPKGNHATITHQVVAPSIVECFENLKARCATMADQKTRVIQPPTRN